jgi:hypothetical protein
MDYLNTDILNIIMPLSTNQNCFLVCKQWHRVFMSNTHKCSTCNKTIKIYDKELWATDDEYCHEYNGTTDDYETLKAMIYKNCNFFKKIPPKLLTHKLCEILIETKMCNPGDVIPDELKNEKIYCMLVQRNSQYINSIPEHARTENVYLQLVRNSGQYINNIPINKQTYLIQLEAVKNYGCALEYIEEQTEELCLEAVKKSGYALKYAKVLTKSVCIEAVNNYSLSICRVPLHFITEQLCFDVVKRNGSALSYIPEHFQTDEICIMAIQFDLSQLQYVKNQTQNISNEACKIFRNNLTNRHDYFKYIKSQPEDLCWSVIKLDSYNISYIHEPTEEMCMFCIEQDYKTFKNIKNPTTNVCFKALEKNPKAIRYIINPTKEMYEFINKNDSHLDGQISDIKKYIQLFKNNPTIFENTNFQ